MQRACMASVDGEHFAVTVHRLAKTPRIECGIGERDEPGDADSRVSVDVMNRRVIEHRAYCEKVASSDTSLSFVLALTMA